MLKIELFIFIVKINNKKQLMCDPEIIRELYRITIRANLCGSKEQTYECLYNLFDFVCKNDLYLLKNHACVYHAIGKKREEIYLELSEKDPKKKEKPLWRILNKTHEKYVENYIKILKCIPGNIPLEIKRSISFYI